MGRQQPGQQAKQQGFARPVRAKNDADPFTREFQIEPVEHHPLFRGKAQPFDR